MAAALRAGYATASTDTGHQYTADETAIIGAFGLNPDGSLNNQLIEDFAWRSVYELALKAKAIIKAYYGESPRYSYWRGMSTGGRQGLAAVQRFPEEYDGVLAGCPAINWENYLLSAVLWQSVVARQEVGHAIEKAKLEAVKHAAIAACDAQDGVVDGLINDPRQCHFDPGILVCKRKNDNETCLTEQEANAIRKIWDGPRRTGTGERLWFGFERGADLIWASQPAPPAGVVEHLRWTKQDVSFDWRTLKEDDFEELIRESSSKFSEIIGTDEPDLQSFRKHGGKLLIWQGESDEIIPPRGIVHYFDRVLAANGGAAQVDSFARLFLLPGVGHATADAPFPGSPSEPDPLFNALVGWVEKGIAPDHVVASQKLQTGALRTRPLCAYPKVAKWKHTGTTNEAANFVCANTIHNSGDFRLVDGNRQ
jgi:pimeloyl-ACP methyl ester carboxylesterase